MKAKRKDRGAVQMLDLGLISSEISAPYLLLMLCLGSMIVPPYVPGKIHKPFLS